MSLAAPSNALPKPDRVLTDIADYVAGYEIKQVFFRDSTATQKAIVEYPIGHRRRRAEGIPLLIDKFKTNLARRFPPKQRQTIFDLCVDPERLQSTPVNEFSDLFVI